VIEVVNTPLQRSYFFAIFTTTFAAGGTYYLLCRIFPQVDYQPRWSEPKGGWEPDTPTSRVDSTSNDDSEKTSVDDFDKGKNGILSGAVEVPELRA